jgi:hypothetical protein
MIEIIIGFYKDPERTELEQLRQLAEIGAQFWSTTNPASCKLEGFLPKVNTPPAYQSDINALWVRCKMPTDYAESFRTIYEANKEAYSALLHDIIFLIYQIDPETGEGSYPPEPAWTELEDVYGEDGAVIGTRPVERRVGGIA